MKTSMAIFATNNQVCITHHKLSFFTAQACEAKGLTITITVQHGIYIHSSCDKHTGKKKVLIKITHLISHWSRTEKMHSVVAGYLEFVVFD